MEALHNGKLEVWVQGLLLKKVWFARTMACNASLETFMLDLTRPNDYVFPISRSVQSIFGWALLGAEQAKGCI